MFGSVKKLFSKDREIARVNSVSWQDKERGNFVLLHGEFRIYEKPQFLELGTGPKMVLRVPLFLISSFGLDTENQLVIERVDREDRPFVDVVTFINGDEAAYIDSALQNVMQGLGIESRKTQKEKAEKEAKEREENERQGEYEVVEEELQLIWKTVGQTWEIVSALGQIIVALPGEDWETVEASWRKATTVEGKSILNLSVNLHSFLPIMESRSADEMYKSVLTLFEAFDNSIKSIISSRQGEEKLMLRYEVHPLWVHLPYYLLFTLTYHETVLCHMAGDSQTALDNLERLRETSKVLKETFRLDLEGNISVFGAALETNDSSQVKRTGQDLETYILETVQKKMEI